MTSSLIRYEEMRIAVQRCATIDEASDLHDRAAALAAYARQRDDAELEVWTQEIKLRASIRIGELVRELDSAQGARTELRDGAVAKLEAVEAAGLNPRTAQRYQELAGPREDNLQAAGRAAAEKYFAEARIAKIPGTQAGLREAVVGAVHAAIGPAEIRKAAKDLSREAAERKKVLRSEKERSLAEATLKASRRIGHRLYGLIYADPPWEWDPWSLETGMDRAPENHYPTMPTEAIAAMVVPAAANASCFLWATVPRLPDALIVLSAWGFTYKSHLVWAKDRIGTGYWVRNKHELLLIGTRGDVPAPSPGTQLASVIEAPLPRRHSEKPALFAEAIERLFPTVPKLEMFCRTPRPGWDAWGNEAGDAMGEAA